MRFNRGDRHLADFLLCSPYSLASMKYVVQRDVPISQVSHNHEIKKQVMLNPGDVPNLVYFSQARFNPGQVAAGHAHTDMSEVFFVEKGEGAITINQVHHALEPGVCVAVHPGDIHEVVNTGTDELVLTYFGIRSE